MYEPMEKSAMGNLNDFFSLLESSEALREIHLNGTGAVAELEDRLRRFYGMRYALCVSNATIGLLAIALALNLKRSEFVTTPYTYGASLAGWLLLENKPIFADIDSRTLTLHPESVRERITPRTKAILAVDIFGNPSDTVALRKLADEFNLWYIADAAQSLGAFRDDLPASALADALVVSFTVGKTIFAGEGGAILTNHMDLYEKLIWYTQHPHRQNRELGLHLDNEFALNGRIHPLAALWANALFDASLENLKRHRANCFDIIDALNETGLTQPIDFKKQGIKPSFFRLTAAWKNKPKEMFLLRELKRRGFTLELEPPPVRLIYRQPAFVAQYGSMLNGVPRCPEAERQARVRFCLKSATPHENGLAVGVSVEAVPRDERRKTLR
ncbi:MAG: DegT/DnrJ/EryC1/StrS family aminotransferase [Candidatus Methanomethylicaceae archaeon]